LVLLVHVNLYVEASEERIARFDGTWVLVIANNSLMFNFSSLCIAPVLCTCVLVININRCVDTSRNGVAAVNGTWVVVVAVLLVIEASEVDVTSISGTSVTIIAGGCFVYAVSSSNIARVCGTCVVIVTVLLYECWVSVEKIAACNCTCIRSIEYDCSVDTYSINTFVCGTRVVVVTVNSGRDASFNWIAFGFEAFVLVVTSDWFVNNSSVWNTEVLGTCVKVIKILC
jgi:hypothetical protein